MSEKPFSELLIEKQIRPKSKGVSQSRYEKIIKRTEEKLPKITHLLTSLLDTSKYEEIIEIKRRFDSLTRLDGDPDIIAIRKDFYLILNDKKHEIK
jgi:hypothetical protein